jgi:hypothetical protein
MGEMNRMTRQNAANTEELAAVMGMFKMNNGTKHIQTEKTIPGRRMTKKKLPGQLNQVHPEEVLPSQKEAFV